MELPPKPPSKAMPDNRIEPYLDLFGITDEDIPRLRQIQKLIAPTIDVLMEEFYDRLLQQPKVQTIFRNTDMIQRAKQAQKSHWMDWVFAGSLNQEYLERCRRIGEVHLNHQVSPDYYLYGYEFLQRQIRRLLLISLESSPERVAIIETLGKAIFLDMSLALAVYCDEMSRGWRENSYRDFLTKLWNRRGLEEHFSSLLHQADRHQRPISLAMMDLDKFKRINDALGHDFGDEVLREISKTISGIIRGEDLAGRWGGEEFLIIFPEANLNQAYEICERTRKAIEQRVIEWGDRKSGVTISIGLDQWQAGESDLMAAIQRADQALYAAKAAGRNRVSCSALLESP